MATPVSTRDHPVEALPRPDFESVYREHVAFVWRCLGNSGVAPHVLEDAVQDVFVIVHRRLPEFRAEGKLRTWIFGIARNVAKNSRRGSQRQRSAPWPPNLELPSRAPGPEELLAGRESAEFVQSFLDTLDDTLRDVFMLAMLEEITLPEVAEMLNLNLNTAYSRLRRARLEFRRALGRRRITP